MIQWVEICMYRQEIMPISEYSRVYISTSFWLTSLILSLIRVSTTRIPYPQQTGDSNTYVNEFHIGYVGNFCQNSSIITFPIGIKCLPH